MPRFRPPRNKLSSKPCPDVLVSACFASNLPTAPDGTKQKKKGARSQSSQHTRHVICIWIGRPENRYKMSRDVYSGEEGASLLYCSLHMRAKNHPTAHSTARYSLKPPIHRKVVLVSPPIWRLLTEYSVRCLPINLSSARARRPSTRLLIYTAWKPCVRPVINCVC